ncbi:MAG: glycosyltransferase family 2 protein [Candidatus Omnitrophica bacterium]|nr:glycosyltransferase family 2 protein [Candidatus Omnitrophota bacterium]
MKTLVVIPTYNESAAIGGLVNKISGQKLDVLVIDDGSSDNTALIAGKSGAVVIINKKNLGKGAGIIIGFRYALAKGYEAVITMDGDGQHLPEEIPKFLQKSSETSAGILIGNRMSRVKNMPLVRIFTNWFMSWILSKITGQLIPDSQCGYRLIRREVFQDLDLKTSKYETESEILIKAARKRIKIESVVIDTIYVRHKSYINPFIDTLRFFRLLLRISNK